jgi:hypothetical protein
LAVSPFPQQQLTMAGEPSPERSFEVPDRETTIEFPEEAVITSAVLTQVGIDLYRLETMPTLSVSASFGDIIEAERLPDGRLLFVQIVEKSDWRVYEFILPKSAIRSARMAQILEHVTVLGGRWERVFGNCLFICMPPRVGWDPTPEIADVIQ